MNLCFHQTISLFFFFNDTATTEIYTLSLHDALPISLTAWGRADSPGRFRLAVFGPGVSDSGCVFVGALFPPTQAGRDTVLGPFKMKFGANPPFDSMNVDLVIPH